MVMQLAKARLIWRITAVLALFATSLALITPVARAATTVSIADGDVAGFTAAIIAANGGNPQIINLATGGEYVLTTAIYDPRNPSYSGLPEITGDITMGRSLTVATTWLTSTRCLVRSPAMEGRPRRWPCSLAARPSTQVTIRSVPPAPSTASINVGIPARPGRPVILARSSSMRCRTNHRPWPPITRR